MLEIMMTPTPKVQPVFKYKQTLNTSTPRSNLRYGSGLSMNPDGSLIAVSEPGGGLAANNSGALYIYSLQANGTYALKQKLGANNNPANAFMGEVMASSTDMTRLVLGAIGDTGKVAEAGSAYVMESVNGTYSQKAKLIASNGVAGDQFGSSVSMTGDGKRVAVGCVYRDDRGTNSGGIYIFDEVGGTFTQTEIILPEAATNNGWFGMNCQFSKDGEYLAVQSNNGTGAVYLYRNQGLGLKLVEKILNPYGSSVGFGLSLLFSPDKKKLFIGAPSGSARSVYIYAISDTGVSLIRTMTQVAAEPTSTTFGMTLALSPTSDTLLVGAPGLSSANGGFYTMTYNDGDPKEENIYRAWAGTGIGNRLCINDRGDIAISSGRTYNNGAYTQQGIVEVMTRTLP